MQARPVHVHVCVSQGGQYLEELRRLQRTDWPLREALPDTVLQVGVSISFALDGEDVAKWHSCDTGQTLTELDPRPDRVIVAIRSTQYEITWMLTIDVEGTHMADPHVVWQDS
jgi:hypothetical protein